MTMKNNEIKRAMELVNTIMPMMEELSKLMNSHLDDWMAEEDLDSYENLSDEELEGLVNEEYYEDEQPEDAYEEWEFDEDEDDEEEIYKIYFNEEQFTFLYELTQDIGYGYVYDSIDNEYIVTVDYDTLYDIKDRLDKVHYHELYEECNRPEAERIIELLDVIYLDTRE